MTVDALVTYVTRASAGMILTWFSNFIHNNLYFAQKGLNVLQIHTYLRSMQK